MTDSIFNRLKLLVGEQAFNTLQQARILLLGVGGVGSWTAEALARSAIGHLTVVDYDTVKPSNLNRQLVALHSTLGMPKAEVIRNRLLDINPELDITALELQLTEENVPSLLSQQPWDYVIDAIDERPPKLAAIVYCLQHHIPVISSMGAANKLSTDGVQLRDISETSGCHLARLIRKSLRKQGFERGLKVVCSPEVPRKTAETQPEAPGEKRPLGTIAFLPATFGLKCAEAVVNHLLSAPGKTS